MPQLKNRPPKYRLHSASGQAVVSVGGRTVYLGAHNSPASRQAYAEVVRRWLSGEPAAPVPAAPTAATTIADVSAAFWRFAETHYRDADGRSTGEIENYRGALRPLVEMFGDLPASDFGPLSFVKVREAMIGKQWCRAYVNRSMNRIRRIFRWAASMEMLPANVPAALGTVAGLAAGRSAARETAPVLPVELLDVQAILPHLSRPVAAIVTLLWFTGARPSEICGMRGEELDRTGTAWAFRPARHKGSWRGRGRTIWIGPEGQKALAPHLKLDPAAWIFSADEICDGTKRAMKPCAYPEYGLRRAVASACEAAGIAKWVPAQLRHSTATRLRKVAGVEAAQLALGHASATTTLAVYAERSEQAAAAIALAHG